MRVTDFGNEHSFEKLRLDTHFTGFIFQKELLFLLIFLEVKGVEHVLEHADRRGLT